jgi:hypothetical protein
MHGHSAALRVDPAGAAHHVTLVSVPQ